MAIKVWTDEPPMGDASALLERLGDPREQGGWFEPAPGEQWDEWSLHNFRATERAWAMLTSSDLIPVRSVEPVQHSSVGQELPDRFLKSLACESTDELRANPFAFVGKAKGLADAPKLDMHDLHEPEAVVPMNLPVPGPRP